jgi:hypothetical protein
MSTRVSRQIGWSQESNLLYEILRKLGELAGIASKVRPYKVYSAMITDDGGDIIVNVLENTIGNIVWTSPGGGEYRGDLTDAFPIDKTWYVVQENSNGSVPTSPFYMNTASSSPHTIYLFTPGTTPDKTTFEIRVYN